MAAAPDSPTGTRAQLVAAAAELFADRGIAHVSLREIARAAHQGNTNAAQYHFGSRAALLAAVLAPHDERVDARRHVLLDQYEANAEADLRTLAAAYVLPLAAELSDEAGRRYLRIVGEIFDRPDPAVDPAPTGTDGSSVHRWRRLVEPLLDPDAATTFHVRFSAMRFAHHEFARRAAASHRRDDQLFTSRITDLVAALLAAPVSGPTARLLAARRTGRRPAQPRPGRPSG